MYLGKDESKPPPSEPGNQIVRVGEKQGLFLDDTSKRGPRCMIRHLRVLVGVDNLACLVKNCPSPPPSC